MPILIDWCLGLLIKVIRIIYIFGLINFWNNNGDIYEMDRERSWEGGEKLEWGSGEKHKERRNWKEIYRENMRR